MAIVHATSVYHAFSNTSFAHFASVTLESQATIGAALNVVHVPVDVSFPNTNSEAICFCALSLSLIHLSGAHLRTLAALPTPILSPPAPIGKTGIVLNTFSPNDCIGAPTAFPSALALSAAKKIIRISPIAKKLTISRENRSIASHRGSLVNSSCAIFQKTIASLPVSTGVTVCVPRDSCICSLEPEELNPLTSAVIKMSEMLRAATVITGAKMIPITFFISKYSSSLPSLIKFLKVALSIINGDATIYNQSTPILAISTRANAMSGKNRAIATKDLIIKTPEVSHSVVTLASVSCAKLSNEEYIVANGQTNHFDLLISSEIVIEVLAAKRSLHFFSPSCPVDARLISSHVNVALFSRHHVRPSKEYIILSYHPTLDLYSPVFPDFA